MLINYFPAVISAGGAFTYNYAAELPESGEENELIIIVDETPSEYYLDTNEPESPADNAVWFMIGSVPGLSVDMDAENNFAFTLQAAKIYDANAVAWTNCNGYIYQDGAWVQFAAGLPPMDTLENTSWSEIRTVSDMGMAEEYWSVGDEKTVMVGETALKVRILGFDHFVVDMYTQEKKGILFEFTEPLSEFYRYDPNGASVTWNDSELRSELNTTFLTSLPEDLQTSIRECWPPYINAYFNEMLCVADKVFVLSYEEYDMGTTYIYSTEAAITSPVAYYEAGNTGIFQSMAEFNSLITRSKYDNEDGASYIALITGARRAASGNCESAYYRIAPVFVV